MWEECFVSIFKISINLLIYFLSTDLNFRMTSKLHKQINKVITTYSLDTTYVCWTKIKCTFTLRTSGVTRNVITRNKHSKKLAKRIPGRNGCKTSANWWMIQEMIAMIATPNCHRQGSGGLRPDKSGSLPSFWVRKMGVIMLVATWQEDKPVSDPWSLSVSVTHRLSGK